MMTKTVMGKTLLLLTIAVIALAIRLVLIGSTPIGLTHDELDYYLSGRFIAFTGSDITGTWKWWTLQPIRTGTFLAELTPFFYVPVNLLLASSVWSAKLTPALFGSLTSLLMFWLLYRLSKKDLLLSTVAGLMTAINPWNILFSRTGYEVIIAIFWFLLSICLFLTIDFHKQPARNRMYLIGAVSALIFGYFSYHGFKFLAPFIGAACVFGAYSISTTAKTVTGHIRQYSLIILFTAIGLVGYSWVNRNAYGGRQDEIEFFNSNTHANEMLSTMERSIPFKFNRFLITNEVYVLKEAAGKYLGFYSPTRLFLAENEWLSYTMSEHGYFYLIELVFVGIGLVIALRHRAYRFFLFLLFIAPVPSIVHVGTSYAIRSAFAMVPLLGLSALGLSWSLRQLRVWPLQVMMGLVVLLSFVNFMYLYIYRYSLLSFDQHMAKYRIAASYLNRLPLGTPVTILDHTSYGFFREYLFYTNAVTRKTVPGLQQQFKVSGMDGTYTFKGLTFSSDCSKLRSALSGSLVMIDSEMFSSCLSGDAFSAAEKLQFKELNHTTIKSLRDGREVVWFYHMPVCRGLSLGFPFSPHNLSTLQIEKLTDKEFCSTWITD